MSANLYTVRLGVMRTFDVVRASRKGWYVKCKGMGDAFIARNNKQVRAAAANSDLSYYEYNHVTVNRGEAKTVCDQQLKRYARYCRVEMMHKLNRPIIDVIEITNVIVISGGSSVNVYHNGNNAICVVCYHGHIKYGFEVSYQGNAVDFESHLEYHLTKLFEEFSND